MAKAAGLPTCECFACVKDERKHPDPWPDFYQAMRTSCENQWKASGVAEATYTAWLGHDRSVSRKHYVAPTEAEYDAVTRVA